MKLFSCGIAIVAIVLMASAVPPNDTETAISADSFVDSVGLNIHLHNANTPYGDFTHVESALTALGVRHVRDGLIDSQWLPYYDRLRELGRLNVKGDFLTDPSESDELLTSFPSRVGPIFEAYEAPNEYDARNGSEWAATMTAFMQRLHAAVKANPQTAGFSIIGPSLTRPGSFAMVASTAQFFDYANLHNYFGGRNPGTGGW